MRSMTIFQKKQKMKTEINEINIPKHEIAF